MLNHPHLLVHFARHLVRKMGNPSLLIEPHQHSQIAQKTKQLSSVLSIGTSSTLLLVSFEMPKYSAQWDCTTVDG